ncbi:hypothetical protein PROFUN_00599 [Planoprotostelium fungivorum]|uniref:Uncharacterized protein n=1 Tax=Planoprotostelium fungivorum TaxID=1890364 RepID=A0A2P6NU46_9EUKA|nr:hypothetical protein PROFUN_00599 [Planoprotostelium fungivorum]
MPKPAAECSKCGKRSTVHRTGLCEVCRSNGPEYKARKRQYEMSDKGKKRRKLMLVGATTRVQNSGEDIKMLPKISTSPDITPPGTPPSPFGGLPNYGVATPSNSMSVLVPTSQKVAGALLHNNTWEMTHVEKARGHVMEFLIRKGMVHPTASTRPSCAELQGYLRSLLSRYPCDDLVVGNTMREILDVFLIFITRCHLQDLAYVSQQRASFLPMPVHSVPMNMPTPLPPPQTPTDRLFDLACRSLELPRAEGQTHPASTTEEIELPRLRNPISTTE